MGIVALRGIEVNGRVGVSAEERKTGRLYLVDVEVRTSLLKAGQTGELAYAIDYGIFSQAVQAVFAREHLLLESAARAIAIQIKEKTMTAETMVIRIKKMRPFLPGNIHYAEIEYHYPEDHE